MTYAQVENTALIILALLELIIAPRHNRVLRNYSSENESKAYDLLHNETPFGSGAQKMTEEFAEMQGKNVEGFSYGAKASGVFHFSIFF